MILNITLLIVQFTRYMLANFMSFILLFNCERDLRACIRQTHRHTLARSPFPLHDFFTGSPLAVIYFFLCMCLYLCDVYALVLYVAGLFPLDLFSSQHSLAPDGGI